MPKQSRTCYALYRGDRLIGCYLHEAVAKRQADSYLGTGLFSPRWEGLSKGEYLIVPFRAEELTAYVAKTRRIHSEANPTIFPSLDAIAEYIESKGLMVTDKKSYRSSYRITTDRGEIEGRIEKIQ